MEHAGIQANTEAPACSTDKQFNDYMQVLNNLTEANMDYLMNELKCRLPCRFTQYTMRVLDGITVPCPYEQGCIGITRVQISATQDEFEEATEKWLYNQDDFIADVGGYLGLMLGVSMLSLFDWASECWKRWRQKKSVKTANRKRPSQQRY